MDPWVNQFPPSAYSASGPRYSTHGESVGTHSPLASGITGDRPMFSNIAVRMSPFSASASFRHRSDCGGSISRSISATRLIPRYA